MRLSAAKVFCTGAAAVLLAVVAGCGSGNQERPYVAQSGVPGGDPDRAPQVMRAAGCASCHTIPGIRGADANVGPPLVHWSRRQFIAGRLTNTPEHLLTWLLDPQEVDPQTAMPDVGLTRQEARDVAAYLDQLR